MYFKSCFSVLLIPALLLACESCPELSNDIKKPSETPLMVDDFMLNTHTGAIFTSDSMRKSICLVSFIYTSCPSICPDLCSQMQRLQIMLQKNGISHVRLLSLTIDPVTDSIETLASFSKQYNTDPDYWYFLTGDEYIINKLVKDSFKQPVVKTPDGREKLQHSNKIVLVDKDLYIRGFYDGVTSETQEAETNKMLGDIEALKCYYKSIK